MTIDEIDPRGLILESYRIGGITAGECRSIFLDWAIAVAPGADATEQIRLLLAHYGDDHPDHPMTETLKAGLSPAAQTGRRGGRKARMG